MWIEGLENMVAYVTFNGQRKPRLKIECRLAYSGTTAGVCCTALSSDPVTATFPIPFPFFEQGGE